MLEKNKYDQRNLCKYSIKVIYSNTKVMNKNISVDI